METFEAVATKLEVRKYSDKPVDSEVKRRVLEAARLTGTGVNKQHLRFVLVEGRDRIRALANDSTSGPWAAGADFAVILLTDPKLSYGLLDAGRAVQAMQLAAWDRGVASGIFTGVDEEAMRRDFDIPPDLGVSAVVTFGYPAGRISGKRKRRKPLKEIAFADRFGQALTFDNG